MRLEVVRHAADGINRVPKVDVIVAVKIDRIFFITKTA